MQRLSDNCLFIWFARKTSLETRDRLARIETRLGTFVTKADLDQELHSMIWKLLGGAMSGATAIVGSRQLNLFCNRAVTTARGLARAGRDKRRLIAQVNRWRLGRIPNQKSQQATPKDQLKFVLR